MCFGPENTVIYGPEKTGPSEVKAHAHTLTVDPLQLTCTGVGPFTGVLSFVHDEADSLVEGQAAVLTLVRFLPSVDSHVHFQTPRAGERGATLAADMAPGCGRELWHAV